MLSQPSIKLYCTVYGTFVQWLPQYQTALLTVYVTEDDVLPKPQIPLGYLHSYQLPSPK